MLLTRPRRLPQLLLLLFILAAGFSQPKLFGQSIPVAMKLPPVTESDNAWSRFRGPNGTGVLESCKVPLPWKDEQVISKLPMPASGNGSPAIWNRIAYLQAGDISTADRYVIAVSIDKPAILWQQKYVSTKHPLHKNSSYASSTPFVDASGVYVAWGAPENVTVKAYSHDGKEKWTRELGRYVTQHGFGTSPVVVDGLVIIYNSQDAQELDPGVAPGRDSMLALDAKTGATVWETDLTATRVCYGVPCIVEENGRSMILCANTGDGFFAIDASNGKKLWAVNFFERRVCSSPVLVGDLVIATEGAGSGANTLFAVKRDGSKEQVYKIKKAAPYVPTPVALEDMLFLWSDAGIVTCVNATNGQTHWSQRVGGNVSGSPVILGNHLVGISQEGVVSVFEARKEAKLLGSIDLGQITRSTPAATSDRVLIRTDESLWVIGK